MICAEVPATKPGCLLKLNRLWLWLIILAIGGLAPVARAQTPQSVSLISVLVLYTPQAANGAGGTTALLNQINTAVVEANTVFQNSEVNARIYLSSVARINYPESGSVSNDLARLRNPNDPVFKTAHQLQNQYGADLVCLITETGRDYDFYGLQGPSAANAYSILRQPFLTGLYDLPVALSFNFGCQLERPYADSAAAFPYAYGYSFYDYNDGTEYSTVDAFYGVRLPYFSNPDLQYDGQALGIPVGEANPCDNALVLNQTAPLVAAFHGPPRQAIPPAISITFPATNDIIYSGTNLPLTATTSDLHGKITSVAWYIDDTNLLTAVSSAPFSTVWHNLPIGVHTLTAVATDNQNATTIAAPVSLTVLPGNDNFASRWPIASLPAAYSEPNALATAEPGEPNNNGQPAVHSLWWTWTAPAATYVVITVPSNSLPLNVSVSTGASLTNLSLLTANSFQPGASRAFLFRAAAGTNYQITVDGQNAATGDVAFSLVTVPGPPNDDFKYRAILAGNNLTINADNTYATQEPGEPDHAGYPGSSSLWWSWTAPADGQVTIAAASDAGDAIDAGVYTGTSLTNLAPVASQAFFYPGLTLVFPVQKGVTCQLALDNNLASYAFNAGPFTFTLNFVTPPPNDNFSNRTRISGSWINLTNSTVLATLEPNEPVHTYSGGSSIWWSWTAPASGVANLQWQGYYNYLDVYTGNALTNLIWVYRDYYTGNFNAVKGTQYAISASGPPGEVVMNLSLSTVQITSPANGANFYLGNTLHPIASTTANDGFIRQIQYFANGQLVASSDRGASYRINWTPPAAGTYVLTATATDALGHQRSSPPVTINVLYPPPANDNFANRTRLQGTWLIVTNSNLGATAQPGEPAIAGENWSDTIWWQWTAPVSGTVTLSSPSGGYLAAFTGTSVTNLTTVSPPFGPIVFSATAGTTYAIGAGGVAGNIVLKLSLSNLKIVSPLDGATFTNGSTFTVVAQPTATEEPVRQVEFFTNGTSIGVVTNAPYSLTLSNLTGGYYTLTAVATDNLGHDRASLPVTVELNPINDEFANSILLSGNNILVTNSIANATSDPDAPPGLFDFPTIWWQWTAPATGWVTLSAPNSYQYGTYLGVYTGTTASNLQTIVMGGSTVAFAAQAGTTYDIAGSEYADTIALQLILSSLQIATPTNGQVLPSGTNLLISVTNVDAGQTLSQVEFFITTNNPEVYWDPTVSLGVVTNPPYLLPWTNLLAGNYSLTAIGQDRLGRTWPTAPVAIAVVPVNDDFTNRTPLTGTSFTLLGSTANATTEPGEPGLFGNGDDQSVWYTWTAPVTGDYFLTLDNYYCQLALYAGDTLQNLTPVPLGAGGLWSAVAGATYQIQVDAFYDYEDFNLQLKSRPPNDNFAAATPLTGTNVTVTGDDTLATSEPGEPLHYVGSTGNSVWYSWTAPESGGEVTATLSSAASSYYYGFYFGPTIGIYTGDTVSNLSVVAASDSGTGSFSSVAGVTYWISVADGPGQFSLNLNFVPAPGNDFFANRTPLSGLNVTVTGTTLNATIEPGEPDYSSIIGVYPIAGGSVWYSWTAPASGYVRIQPAQACQAVFTGNDISNLTAVVAGQFPTELDFAALAGQTYQIAVVQSELWPPGPFSWSLAMDKVTITNPVAGAIFPAGTNVEVDTSTINLDGAVTSVTFYANTNLVGTVTNPPFSLILSNVPIGDYVLTAQATDASGVVATSQPVDIRVPPANDNFANRIFLTGTNVTFSGDNTGATTEPGENLPGGASGRTLWWSWTAPTNGNITVTITNLSGFQAPPVPAGTIFDGVKPAEIVISGTETLPNITAGPLLSIYTGSVLTNLNHWVSNATNYYGTWYGGSPFTFAVVSGQTCQISLDGINGNYGAASVNLSLTPFLPGPPNDNFAQRTILTGANITTNGTTVGATLELTDPDLGNGLDARTVWYSWTAPTSGTVALSVLGPYGYNAFYPYLAFPPYGIYAGSTPGSLIPLATGNYVGNASFYALAGTAYQIEVATPNENEEAFTLTLTAPTPPVLSPAPPVRRANGSYDLHVIGSVGQSFFLQSSLNGSTWTTIDTDTLLATSLDYIDTTPIGHPARAYRLQPLDTADNTQPFKMLAPNSNSNANPANGFTLNLTGVSGTPFLIQTSTNLVDWYNLTSGVLIDNAFNYTDYAAPNYPRRFYRPIPQ